MIESFEARYAECHAEAAQHKEALASAQAKLENSQLRVSELVQSKGELRQQFDQAAASGADAEAALRAEVARLQVMREGRGEVVRGSLQTGASAPPVPTQLNLRAYVLMIMRT